jgi:hypothetical protein
VEKAGEDAQEVKLKIDQDLSSTESRETWGKNRLVTLQPGENKEE